MEPALGSEHEADPALSEEPQRGCLVVLWRVLLRLLGLAFSLLLIGTALGALPGEILAVTRPILQAFLGIFGVALGPPVCLDPAVREMLPFCRLFAGG